MALAACLESPRQPAAQPQPPAASGAPSGAAPIAPAASAATAPADSLRWCAGNDEAETLQCSRGRAWRSGDTLYVRPGSGAVKAYVTKAPSPPDGDDGVEWQYLGALVGRSSVHHFLQQALYEDQDFVLVHGGTGRSVRVVGDLVPSPDGAYLASAAESLNVCEGETGLEIWRMTDSLPVRELNVEPYACHTHRGWAPSDLEWRGADTLRFIAEEVLTDSVAQSAEDAVAGHPVRKYAAFVVRTPAGWKLVGAAAAPPEPPTDSDEET